MVQYYWKVTRYEAQEGAKVVMRGSIIGPGPYVLYFTTSTRLVFGCGKTFSDIEEAEKARDEWIKQNPTSKDISINDYQYFKVNIEKDVERINLRTGHRYQEKINTPQKYSPSVEEYWETP